MNEININELFISQKWKFNFIGKSPRTKKAIEKYLLLNYSQEPKTQEEIAKEFGLAEKTIRDNIKKLQKQKLIPIKIPSQKAHQIYGVKCNDCISLNKTLKTYNCKKKGWEIDFYQKSKILSKRYCQEFRNKK